MILSDRGTQFVSETVYTFMQNMKIMHSMSRPHKPVENCYIETFWKSLKTELGKTIAYTIESFKVVLQYYEHYYNYERPHSALDYNAPMFGQYALGASCTSPSQPPQGIINCHYEMKKLLQKT